MADSKITALTALTAADPVNDMFPVVDVSDTSMAASGTTKKISVNNILGASGTATLASATITGALTVDTATLVVDPTLNKVGIGVATLTGLSTLNVAGDVAITSDLVLKNGSGTAQGYIFGSSGLNYRVIASNPHVWQEGGTDLMRLNSTGLGVGGSPNAKVSCAGSSSANVAADFQINRSSSGTGIQTGPNLTFADGTTNNTVTIQNSQGRFGIWNYGAGSWNERVSVDSSGNVGIGVTPSARFHSKAGAVTQGGIIETTGANALLSFADAGTSSYTRVQIGSSGNNLAAFINSVQSMTLDASGNLLVGTTTAAAKITALAGASGQTAIFQQPAQNFWCVLAHNQATSGDNSFVLFGTEASFTSRGSITYNRAAGQVSYNITSDYRLKEDVKPLTGALNRISSLKPSTYKFKETGFTCEGFIAHELAEVIPAAVTGEKDAVNEDGSIKAQGVDLSKVVPVLVAAIQELAAEVNALKNA